MVPTNYKEQFPGWVMRSTYALLDALGLLGESLWVPSFVRYPFVPTGFSFSTVGFSGSLLSLLPKSAGITMRNIGCNGLLYGPTADRTCSRLHCGITS